MGIMPMPPIPPLLDETLRIVARRYRLPANAMASFQEGKSTPATALAMAIERGREEVTRGKAPDAALTHAFLEALADLIQEAMRPASGDPVFQAMVLRHRH